MAEDTHFKYKKIVHNLIDESFPSLNKKNVFIIRVPMLEKYYAGVFWLFPGVMFIFVNSKLGLLKKSSLKGMFAHELCHLEKSREMGWFKHFGYYVSCGTSKDICAENEKATDKKTIRKGYGKDLYSLHQEKPFDETLKDFYLSPKEIMKYSKKIGKW